MKQLTIGLGTDHRGYILKENIKTQKAISEITINWKDFGAFSIERSDYPLFAQPVALALIEKEIDYGILLCGTGIGMAIAANRYPSIRAGVAWTAEIARRAKEEDNINLLVLPADYLSGEDAHQLIAAWLQAHFKAGRYQERINQLDIK